MSKRALRLLAGILIAVLFIGSISACTPKTTQNPATPPVATTQASADVTAPAETAEPELTLNFFTFINYPFVGPIPEAITAKTGIKLNVWDSTNRNDKYPLMLASGDLPDLIVLFQGTDVLNNYINAKAIIPINDLIDQYGPNIKKYYGDYLKRGVYTDKLNYYIPTECGKTSDPSSGILMRQDLLAEIVGDRAINGDSFTTEEFKTILNAFKTNHPEINGTPTIPMSVFSQGLVDTFEGFWGFKPYYENGTTLSYKWRDPRYIDMLLYLNDLMLSGDIDVDWPTMKPDAWYSAMSKGNIFSAASAWWEADIPNSALQQAYGKDTKSQYYLYQLTAPGITIDKVTSDPRNYEGNLAVAITKVNKNPERTMKFLDFMGSPETHYLVFWGVEGMTWDKVDGKMVARQNVIDEYMADWKPAATKYGVRNWGFMWNTDMMVDNVPLDMLFASNPSPSCKFAYKTSAQTKYDVSFYNGLQPTSAQPELINHQKVTDIVAKALPLIVNAKSQDEARTLYAQMVKDCDDAGAAQVEAIVNTNAAARRDLWGMN
jgi:putative aldouronate transport system substrate-binding protein